MTLAQRLFLFAVAVMLPVVLVVVLFGIQLGRSRQAEVRESVLRQSQQANSEMERIVEGMRTLLVSVASTPIVQAMREPECSDYLHTVALALPQIGSLGVIGLDGQLMCVDDKSRPKVNYGDRDYFRRAVSSRSFTTGLFTRARTDPTRMVLPFSLPLLNPDGTVRAVVAAGLSLQHLNAVVAGWKIPKDGSLTLADREGTILARNPDPERFVGTKIPAAYLPLVTAAQPGVAEITSQDGTRRILGYLSAAVPPEGIYVSSGVSTDEAYATARAAWIWNVAAIGLGLLFALAASHLLGRTLIHAPIEALIGRAKAWSSGAGPSAAAKLGGPKEVREIGQALDQMGTSLTEQTRKARENEDRLRRMIRGTPYPLLLQADDGRIIEVNESWWRHAGHIDQSVRNDPTAWLRGTSDRSYGESPFDTPFDERMEPHDWHFVGGDGRQHSWEVGVVPLGALPDGHRIRLIAAADVTERNEAIRSQELLVAELNHRVKNTLAIVQSIGMQTANHSADAREFASKFAIRLQALARTHDLLTERAWDQILLRDLVNGEIASLPDATTVAVEGPAISLPAELAVSVGLVLHELSTNAIRHGCFSAEGGRLAIAWRVEDTESGRFLQLTWTEACAKAPGSRGKSGFGTRLIERSLAKLGSGESEWTDKGLHFRMDVRLPRSRDGGKAVA